MHRRFRALLALSPLLAGCLGNPNVMVFGTNTTLGVSAGAGATSAPSIVVGYERQEAVVMPIVAATGAKGGEVTSCAISPTTAGKDHPCVLVGRGVVAGGDESDSLSVLASFGTEGKARTTGTESPEVSGRITQYFATGLAARRLAEQAGAASVATGDAARGSLFTEAERTAARELGAAQTAGRENAARKVESAGDAGFAALLPRFDAAANTGTRFQLACKGETTAAGCADKIRTSPLLRGIQPPNWQAIAALAP